MYSKLGCFLLSIAALPFVLGSPVELSHLQSRQTYNCKDTAAPFNTACWDELDLENWLNDATTGWNQTTHICQGTGPGQDGSACCLADEPWSTCFLRLAHGTSGDDCTVLNTGFCSYDPKLAVNPAIVPQVAYVMKNIYAINNFFTTWYTALQYATSNIQLTLQPIVNALDKPSSQNYELSFMLTALTAGLAIIPGVGEGALALDATTVAIGTALLAGLQSAPGVAKAIWPSGTTDSQNVQIAQLDDYVGQLNSALATNLGAGLELIMSDMPSFIGFAKSGAFSGSTVPSLANETKGLDIALKTYVLTLAMGGNGYKGAFYGTTTAAAFEAGSDKCDFRIAGCTCTLDSNGICKSSSAFGGTLGGQGWYWDSNSQNLYSLMGESPPISEDTLMQDIMTNGWSTLPLVFNSGAKCVAGGGSQNPLTLNADGTVDTSCVSQLALKAV